MQVRSSASSLVALNATVRVSTAGTRLGVIASRNLLRTSGEMERSSSGVRVTVGVFIERANTSSASLGW